MSLEPPVFVPPEWVERRRDEVTVADVRERRDYEDLGHVPGAVNLPFDSFREPGSVAAGKLPAPETFADLLGERGIARDDPIVAYDDEGGVLAARLLLTAAAYGHEGPLYVLDGGIDAWREARPLADDRPAREPVEYDPAPPDGADSPVADREAVEDAVQSDDAVVVDTRTAAEYEQSHVPGAVRVGWESLVEDGRLRDREEIEALLAERGVERGRRIVLYCNTARRLSHTFAALAHLGYERLAFYEGSLTDWVRAEAPEWDPNELQRQVLAYADRGFDAMVADLGEDVLDRLKLIGLYHQKQEGYFMLRTKVPGGILTAEQARTIGEVADEFARAPEEYGGREQNPEFGDGYLDVTTRQDVQMHWIEIGDAPEIWERYEAVGLTTMQACGNSVRNVVGCPAAGLHAEETVDVRPQVESITERFLGDCEYANLPRKLKVSATGCTENCARAQINDVAFTPAVKDGRDGFHVRVGGGLSDGPRAASDLGIFVEPDRLVELVRATAELFADSGSYLDTAVNRLRFLVDEWGVDRFREELERRADFAFEPAGESLTTGYRGDHVGVHEQADGRRYVGLNVPVGRMGGDEFAELATLSEAYGDGEVRLTPNQNVLVPHVEADEVDAFRDEPLVERYGPDPGPFERGVVACTGREYCTYGIVETKNRAVRWARRLDEWLAESDVDVDRDAIRIHMSGCSASCAQPQVADVGLRGEVRRTPEGTKDAADVGLGGDLGRDAFVDWVAGSVPLEGVPPAVKRVLAAFAEESDPGEAFAEWTRRVPDERLRALVTEADADAAGAGTADPAATEVN